MKNIDLLKQHDNFYKPLPFRTYEKPLVSIILPCFNVASSLPLVLSAINNQSYKHIEVIVVDDCSLENIKNCIDKSIFPTRYIRNLSRRDRSASRNEGLYNSKGKYTLILDPDILLNKCSVEKLVGFANVYGGNLYIGFRENISRDKALENISNNIEADHRKDIRYSYNYTPRVPLLSIFGQEKDSRLIEILNETNLLRDFPVGRVIGSWDLPSIVTGHTMFMSTAAAIRCGGFDENYAGWGFDDIAFGAKMIIGGHKVIPVVEAAGFHIDHLPHSASEMQKWIEFSNNRKRYFAWLNEEYDNKNFDFNRTVSVIEDVVPERKE